MKRFWNGVSYESAEGGFQIKLDHRAVRTPAKRPLIVPTEKIASHVTAEWDAQVEQVDPAAMPWTRTANAAIDKVAIQRTEVKEHLAGYAGTDLLCYRADGPDSLVLRQQEVWDPILAWFVDHFDVSMKTTTGIMPVAQDPVDIKRLAMVMDKMTDFQLAGFHDLVGLSGSFAIALAVVEEAFSSENLWSAACLDETWQAEQWGEDEEALEHTKLKKVAFLHATEVYRAA